MRWIVLAGCLVACGESGPIEPTYENVLGVVERSCGSDTRSCHGGSRGNGGLNLEEILASSLPITDALVNVPACQYDLMDRVEPGDPDNSWLFIKLTAAHDDSGRIEFTPDPGWDPGIEMRADGTYPPSECPNVTRDGELTFGNLMPENVTPIPLKSREIQLFRDWILAGAPGPS